MMASAGFGIVAAVPVHDRHQAEIVGDDGKAIADLDLGLAPGIEARALDGLEDRAAVDDSPGRGYGNRPR